MVRLLDTQKSVAIILGAHDWTKAGLASAPSFRRSAAHFHAWLIRQSPQGLGLEPDLVVNLFDDPAPAGAQLVRIRDTLRSLIRERSGSSKAIRDVLIYYIGHGTCELGKRLNLLVRDSAEGMEEQSSIGAPDLAQVLRVAAPQQRRLVILDCCFSEAAAEAFGAMGALDEAVAAAAARDLVPQGAPPERGTLLLCSSPRNRFSIGVPEAERTLFTGTLLSVLSEGVGWRRTEMLSFADLREDIYDRMLRDFGGDPPRPALHQPDQQDGDLSQLPAFPNAAARIPRQGKKRGPRQARGVNPNAARQTGPIESLTSASGRRPGQPSIPDEARAPEGESIEAVPPQAVNSEVLQSTEWTEGTVRFVVGDKVVHQFFGEGTLQQILRLGGSTNFMVFFSKSGKIFPMNPRYLTLHKS
jgi:hypothetical protein